MRKHSRRSCTVGVQKYIWPSRERWVPLLLPPHSRCWGEPRIPLRFVGRRGQHTSTSTRPRIGKALASGALPPRPLSHLPRVFPWRGSGGFGASPVFFSCMQRDKKSSTSMAETRRTPLTTILSIAHVRTFWALTVVQVSRRASKTSGSVIAAGSICTTPLMVRSTT